VKKTKKTEDIPYVIQECTTTYCTVDASGNQRSTISGHGEYTLQFMWMFNAVFILSFISVRLILCFIIVATEEIVGCAVSCGVDAQGDIDDDVKDAEKDAKKAEKSCKSGCEEDVSHGLCFGTIFTCPISLIAPSSIINPFSGQRV
jgi:hypothetical protein